MEPHEVASLHWSELHSLVPNMENIFVSSYDQPTVFDFQFYYILIDLPTLYLLVFYSKYVSSLI